MAWHVMFAHHIAQLHPTLTAGTAVDNYPWTNVRTLPANQRGRITPDGVNGIKLDFNRGGTGAAVNCILILNHNMSGSTWSLISDDNSGFASATTLIAAVAPTTGDIYKRFDAGASSTEQYLRWAYAQTAGAYYEFGVITIGKAFQSVSGGPALASERISAEPDTVETEGYQKWNRSLLFTRANAETLSQYASQYYVPNSTNTVIDAFGGGGGKNPVAIIDDSGPYIWYGPARIQVATHGANYSEVYVDMDVVRRGVF